jgi:O-antigen ligase
MRFELFAAALLPLALAAPAPLIRPRAGQAIPGKYIVKMKNDALQDVVEEALKYLSKKPAHVYGFGKYKGFAAELADDLVELLQNLDFVCSSSLGL